MERGLIRTALRNDNCSRRGSLPPQLTACPRPSVVLAPRVSYQRGCSAKPWDAGCTLRRTRNVSCPASAPTAKAGPARALFAICSSSRRQPAS